MAVIEFFSLLIVLGIPIGFGGLLGAIILCKWIDGLITASNRSEQKKKYGGHRCSKKLGI